MKEKLGALVYEREREIVVLFNIRIEAEIVQNCSCMKGK